MVDPGHPMSASQGPSTDAANQPVVDPTRNVLDLVAAAIQRQDDLREMQAAHVSEVLALRSEHYTDLREAESHRIDAIRAVDVQAVGAAAQVAATQANTLAAQVATSAETLRTQVASAATAATVALAAALEPIQKDIADLRRVQYEAVGGRAQVEDSGLTSRAYYGLIVASIGLVTTFLLGIAGVILTLVIR